MTVPAHRIALGEHLRDLRRDRGWASQEAFALHVGLDRTTSAASNAPDETPPSTSS